MLSDVKGPPRTPIKEESRSPKARVCNIFEENKILTVEQLSNLDDSEIESLFISLDGSTKSKAYECRREAQMAVILQKNNISPSTSIDKMLQLDETEQTNNPVFTIDECTAVLQKLLKEEEYARLIGPFKELCFKQKMRGNCNVMIFHLKINNEIFKTLGRSNLPLQALVAKVLARKTLTLRQQGIFVLIQNFKK